MTVKELSQLYYLTHEIEADQRRLDEITRLACTPSTPNLTGMPHGINNSSKVERMTAEMVDLQAIIAARQIQCIHERARLERWISEIPDSLTRQIFHYRFVECLRWSQVASQIGAGNTPDRVKKICYRYIDREDARSERQLHEADARANEWEQGQCGTA